MEPLVATSTSHPMHVLEPIHVGVVWEYMPLDQRRPFRVVEAARAPGDAFTRIPTSEDVILEVTHEVVATWTALKRMTRPLEWEFWLCLRLPSHHFLYETFLLSSDERVAPVSNPAEADIEVASSKKLAGHVMQAYCAFHRATLSLVKNHRPG
jgi:hypothetical protein